MSSIIEQHLAKLAEDLELSPLAPKGKDQRFHLTLAPGMELEVEELDPGVAFWGQIVSCPLQRREDLFMLLMRANFLGQGTGGGAIALDAQGKFLTLSLSLPYDMNYHAFKVAIEDFTNYIDYWREEIAAFEKDLA